VTVLAPLFKDLSVRFADQEVEKASIRLTCAFHNKRGRRNDSCQWKIDLGVSAADILA